MQRKKVFALAVSIALMATPSLMLAQSYDTYQRGSRSYGLSSDAQRAVEALGAASAAQIAIPVLLGVEVSSLTKNFGDPRGDGTRLHEGLDILAPEGTPIVSPTDAVVLRVGTGEGSGIYVRTMNPGGESYVYMHLSAIASTVQTGGVLKRGDLIGFVGNTGNASGGPAHLHFEIRKDGALDPHPRLTQTFTLAERIRGVEQALQSGGASYVATYTSHFRQTFIDARAQGIAVPQQILSLLDTVTPTTPSVASGAVPSDTTIVFGNNNAQIVRLQQFLIKAASGSDAAQLARAGATGYFGPVTRAALVEYQRTAGLTATGVVDAATYTQIFALTGEGDSSETEPVVDGGGVVVSPVITSFNRDLELGSTGEDVRRLQQFLNAHSAIIASDGPGSPGLETDYFGSMTRAALVRYQASAGISPAVGYFGPITRAHMISATP